MDNDLKASFFIVAMAHCVLLQESMRQLRAQWNGMDDRARAPYEAMATHDANRYRREVCASIINWPLFTDSVYLCRLSSARYDSISYRIVTPLA